MTDAKNKIRAVQSKLKNNLLKNTTVKQIWDQAVEINKKGNVYVQKNITQEIKSNPQVAKAVCPTFKSSFIDKVVEVLGSEPPKKDF